MPNSLTHKTVRYKNINMNEDTNTLMFDISPCYIANEYYSEDEDEDNSSIPISVSESILPSKCDPSSIFRLHS